MSSSRTATPSGTRARSSTPNSAVWARLTAPPRPGDDLPPVRPPSRVMRSDEEEASVDRLYRQSAARHAEALKKAEERAYQRAKTPADAVMSPEDTASTVDRLYRQRMEAKRGMASALEQKYLAKSQVRMKKFSDDAEAKSAVDRLVGEPEAFKSRSQQLFERYNPRRPIVRRSGADIASNVSRWYEGGFAKRQ